MLSIWVSKIRKISIYVLQIDRVRQSMTSMARPASLKDSALADQNNTNAHSQERRHWRNTKRKQVELKSLVKAWKKYEVMELYNASGMINSSAKFPVDWNNTSLNSLH